MPRVWRQGQLGRIELMENGGSKIDIIIFELIEQSPVADLEQLCRLSAVAFGFFEGAGDEDAL